MGVVTEDTLAARKALGLRIKRVRQAQGLSQKRLADMVGIDRTYLIQVEQGKRNLGFNNLHKIAAGLGVTLSELSETNERVYYQ